LQFAKTGWWDFNGGKVMQGGMLSRRKADEILCRHDKVSQGAAKPFNCVGWRVPSLYQNEKETEPTACSIICDTDNGIIF
jgi:hypothetical protein